MIEQIKSYWARAWVSSTWDFEFHLKRWWVGELIAVLGSFNKHELISSRKFSKLHLLKGWKVHIIKFQLSEVVCCYHHAYVIEPRTKQKKGCTELRRCAILNADCRLKRIAAFRLYYEFVLENIFHPSERCPILRNTLSLPRRLDSRRALWVIRNGFLGKWSSVSIGKVWNIWSFSWIDWSLKWDDADAWMSVQICCDVARKWGTLM